MRKRLFLMILFALMMSATSCKTKEKTQEQVQIDVDSTVDERIDFHVDTLTLNYQTNQMEIAGTLKKLSNGNIKSVWIWVYFTNPEFMKSRGWSEAGSWSDEPIEITNPFESGNEKTIVAKGNFHWATNPDLPKEGYFARINTSVISKENARLPVRERNYDTTGAFAVSIVKY